VTDGSAPGRCRWRQRRFDIAGPLHRHPGDATDPGGWRMLLDDLLVPRGLATRVDASLPPTHPPSRRPRTGCARWSRRPRVASTAVWRCASLGGRPDNGSGCGERSGGARR